MAPDPITREQVRKLLASAAATQCEHEGWTRFGPLPIRVRSTEPVMVEDAVRHSTGDPALAPWPEVTVHLLDANSVPAGSMPAGLLPGADGAVEGMWNFVDGPCVATRSDALVWLADGESLHSLRWVHSVGDLPVWEAARPMRFAIRWASALRGAAMLHCAAVAGPSGAVLLTGRGGAGKSTTAFACLGSGLHLLGDDYCIVDPAGDVPTVHGTYVRGNLDDHSLALLPHLRNRMVGEAPRGKKVIALDAFGACSSAPVVAACEVVQAPGEPTRLVPVSRGALLRSLAPSTQVQIPGVPRETFAATTETVRKVATFELRVGDLGDVPAVLRELVGGA